MKFLVEIGVEELPAIPFLKELKNIPQKWQKIVDDQGISCEFRFDFTPRRLVFSGEIGEFSRDSEVENIGAPRSVAMKDGQWTAAAIGFAKKCAIGLDELEFREIKGKEVLYHKSVIKGKNVREILPLAVENFIKSLNFGKSMRWGRGEFEFIRPVRSLAVVLDSENLECEIFGVKSEMAFFPHRKFGYEMVKFSGIDDYFEKLNSHGIILKSTERKERILRQIAQIERENGLKIELDLDLLDEIVAITEYPTALLGSFESEFLEIPSEVIITSMKENQRYFAVFENEKLSNRFIVVSNAISDDERLIVRGNEKVLRARLSDAKFFWDSDLAGEFSSEKLKNIAYLSGLGSIYDKEIREREIARILGKIYHRELKFEFDGDFESSLDRAIMLSKADLTTNMVYEFTNLQGVMGGYYAAYRRENPFVIEAIKEQYLPEGAVCPRTLFSSVVAISCKLDTLMGLFSVGKIPTGNKDPYALRRAAFGVIKIVLNLGINFNLREILEAAKGGYRAFEMESLVQFIFDRFYAFCENPSIPKACINSGESDIFKLYQNIKALESVVSAADFREKFSTFKRLANIIKEAKIGVVNENLFENESEGELNSAFKSLNLDESDTKIYLENLFNLKPQIDKFFDSVMINSENLAIKDNRIALIGQIYQAFLKIADIKEISI